MHGSPTQEEVLQSFRTPYARNSFSPKGHRGPPAGAGQGSDGEVSEGSDEEYNPWAAKKKLAKHSKRTKPRK